MDVNSLVKKAVDQINESAQAGTESRVKDIVNSILKNEQQISFLQKSNAEYKRELKELELPKPVSLEV